MFCNDIELAKIIKLWRQSHSKHQHIPSSLVDCLDQPSSSRRESWRLWLIILFVLPTLYYINDLLMYEKLRFYNRSSKHADVETTREFKDLILSTSTTEMTTAAIAKVVTTRDPPVNLPICTIDKSQLGIFSIRRPQNRIFIEHQYPIISMGGYYTPAGCQSRHKVGILVPYRDREENLSMFLYNIHLFLTKQKLEYRIFVVEQKGTDDFNKGRLFNAGFVEMKKYGSWHCIVFHDVDLIPLDERILYSCPSWPRHMCATVVQKFVDPSYRSSFGGVTSMTPAQFEKVNGYSNLYWGWGGEDDDMFWRLRVTGFPVSRYNKTIARYISLPHRVAPRNPLRYRYLRRGLGKYKQEGLSSLEYKLISVTERPLYTYIVVDINPSGKIISDPLKNK